MRAAGALVSEIAEAVGVSLPTLRASFGAELADRPAAGPDLFSAAPRADEPVADPLPLPMQTRPAKARRKAAGGRPRHEPTGRSRDRVRILVAAGMGTAEIAVALGISEPTVRRHYAAELATGGAEKRAELIERLYRTAMAGNTTALREMLAMIDKAALERVADTVDARAQSDAASRKPETPGKKEQAAEDARTIAVTSKWAAVLRGASPPDGQLQ